MVRVAVHGKTTGHRVQTLTYHGITLTFYAMFFIVGLTRFFCLALGDSCLKASKDTYFHTVCNKKNVRQRL